MKERWHSTNRASGKTSKVHVPSNGVRHHPCHHDKLTALRRIEGQVRGLEKMVEDERYCVDILNAVGAVIGALRRVESKILKDHLDACVKTAFLGKSEKEREEKLAEIYGLLASLRK